MEKVKSAERAAIIKSRPNSEQKNGGTTMNSDGTPRITRPSQIFLQQHGGGPKVSDTTGPTVGQTVPKVPDRGDGEEEDKQVAEEEDKEAGGDDELENQYFFEDEIFCFSPKTGRVKFGLVLENYDESEEETAPEEDALKRGEIRACWHPQGYDEIIKQRKVGLVDRTLMPGDVVRRMVPGRDTQRGYCHEISVRADLRIAGTKYVVRNVPSERLRPLLSMPKDNAVCLDSWVGSTKQINEKLVLKSSCGSLVELCPVNDLCLLRDPNMRFRTGYFSETLFYPGQQLAGPMSELVNGKWLTTSNEMKYSRKNWSLERRFTVQSVELQGVTVHWQCKGAGEDLELLKEDAGIGSLQQPPDYVTGDDLKRLKKLNLFESCMLQINDKNYLTLEEKDVICVKSAWRKEMTSRYRKLLPERFDTTTGRPATDDGVKGVEKAPSKLLSTSAEAPAKERSRKKLSVRGIPKDIANGHVGESDEWETDDEDGGDQSDGAGSNCSATTPKTSPKKSPLVARRVRKLKRKQAAGCGDRFPNAGEEVVTEALVVYSAATVVWQDGTIESNIPSTELRPIHHLDDHEFFPGDFVLAGNTDPAMNPSFRDYGVIQNVDHRGRTARVKWFSTYTCTAEPQPTYSGESEVSVYDLKDHPDFQYRPGTIVIRVANFSGDEGAQGSTAGQVVDNYTNGMVKVWWVDGRVSMCWPQDIFEVGQYDGENNFWGSVESDNNSWETEDETSEFGDNPSPLVSKTKLAANLERARVAIGRLEELFNVNPHVQNQEIMRKLMMVYKKCRHLDRLMNTSFFHEQHFMGLVERVRKSNNQTTAERVQDQKARLFNQTPGSKTSTPVAEGPYGSVERAALSAKRSLFSPITPDSTASGECVEELESVNEKSSDNATLLNMELDFVNNVCMSMNDELNNTTSVFDLASGSEQREESEEAEEATDRESVPARLCSLLKVQLRHVLEMINTRYCEGCAPNVAFKEIVTIVEMNMPSSVSVPASPLAATPDTPSEAPPGSELISPALEDNNLTPPPVPAERFQIVEAAPTSHKYHLTVFQTSNAQTFYKAVQREHWLLRTGLPPGVWVRSFEDRLDLLSVMIEGPQNTPYEGGLFLFDVQLGMNYPREPPLCHYISYCSDRLNPNLYEDGKVCVSLLGTWSGRGSELWGPTSTLLQVIVSIQGLILVAEPYFNEAGYEKLRGSQQGKENSRMYNEMVLLKLVQSMTKLMANPPKLFREQILEHFRTCGHQMHQRIRAWMELSNDYKRQGTTMEDTEEPAPLVAPQLQATSDLSAPGHRDAVEMVSETQTAGEAIASPDFPLIPASRGFCLTLTGLLDSFQKQLQQLSNDGK
ncbi:(E3-independent) E2 ubiquitin-conjugating enzyme [Anopheles bellator]|uniref:(E3-independent) E2 ubiquitin-conjugating enzyme n=1 Tax=Anopheles bellator TaxID=139047 RepID=UPI002648A3F5|nr:(E3-independent) E2 ubiquitin-conjugating enzyme [Anopheles bellator]